MYYMLETQKISKIQQSLMMEYSIKSLYKKEETIQIRREMNKTLS